LKKVYIPELIRTNPAAAKWFLTYLKLPISSELVRRAESAPILNRNEFSPTRIKQLSIDYEKASENMRSVRAQYIKALFEENESKKQLLRPILRKMNEKVRELEKIWNRTTRA